MATALALLLPQTSDPEPANQVPGPYTYASHRPTPGSGGTSALPGANPERFAAWLLGLDAAEESGGLAGLGQAIARVFLYVACVLDGECLASLTELQALGEELGSSTLENMRWTAGLLSRAATMWPLLPNVPRPLAELMSLGLGFVPVVGDLYDLVTGITGYDVITGEHVPEWVQAMSLAAVFLPLVSGSQLSAVDDLTSIRYVDELTSGLSPKLQRAITQVINDSGDPGLLLAFRKRAFGAELWDGVLGAKPEAAETILKGKWGERFCKVPQEGGGYRWGRYVSDLDGAWAITGSGTRLSDNELREGVYREINIAYGEEVITHGAHLNAVLDGIRGNPLGPVRYDTYFRYVTDPYDPVYIFGRDGYVGTGLMGATYAQAMRGKIRP
jgi:hypothetical protein